VVTVPVTDLVCTDDLDPNGAETTSDLQALAQDLYHLIIETPGSNLADPTGGLGIEGILSGPAANVRRALAQFDAQIGTDPRVANSVTTVTSDANGQPLSANIEILPIGSLLPIQFAWSKVTGLQRVNQ
jgi:hypothetical protein